jgi:hypothetical protein
LILANLGRDAEAKEAVVRPLCLNQRRKLSALIRAPRSAIKESQ